MRVWQVSALVLGAAVVWRLVAMGGGGSGGSDEATAAHNSLITQVLRRAWISGFGIGRGGDLERGGGGRKRRSGHRLGAVKPALGGAVDRSLMCVCVWGGISDSGTALGHTRALEITVPVVGALASSPRVWAISETLSPGRGV